MRFTHFYAFLGGCLATIAVTLLAPIATASYVGAPFTIVFMPFDPVDEITMQSAIAKEEAGTGTVDQRLKLLRDIEIRSALEDHQRLHYELG